MLNSNRVFLVILLGIHISVAQINLPPDINGEIDKVWEKANTFYPEKLVRNIAGVPIENAGDFSGSFRTLWDTDNFYLLVEITDDQLNNHVETSHHNDNTEIYFDLDHSKLSEYDGTDDDQIRFVYGWPDTFDTKRGAQDIEFSQKTTETGWLVEVRFPWTSLTSGTFIATPGTEFGFDVMITDNDGADKKDHILAWHSPVNDAWKDPSIFGVMKLLESGTTDSVYYDPSPPTHDAFAIDESKVRKTLYVDQRHVDADDGHSGETPDRPFKTIAAALAAASQHVGNAVATKIVIKPGTYREGGLRPIPSGSANAFMNTELIIEGSEPDSVIISGSDEWPDGWTAESGGVWSHEWPYAIEPQDAWGGRVTALGARREMVFIDGVRMRQVLAREDMEENTFFVVDNEKIYVKPAPELDFENTVKEVSLRGDGIDAPWPPAGLLKIPAEKDKVVLRNLVFQHANMRLQNAGTVKLEGWKVLIDHCRIVWNNGFGLQVGNVEQVDIRNSIFDHNGGAGIMSWGLAHGSWADNSTSFNNWRGDMGGLHSYAVAGIKMHHTSYITLERHLARFNLASGLWSDLNVFELVYQNCTIENNWGPGLLVEISRDVQINNCTIRHNATGIRIHSAHDVVVDGCGIEGNAIQFSLYNDHRDFGSADWVDRLGLVWDKTPARWSIINCDIIAEDNPAWQDSVEQRIPSWIRYSNPGYQPFFHFSAKQGYLDFFETATIHNNTWTHPATDTPFMDADGHPLSLEEWRQYIKTLKETLIHQRERPGEFNILTNYPNPFNASTTISFSVRTKGRLKLEIFNVLGKRIRLLSDQTFERGVYRRLWDGRDDTGRDVPSGVYFYSTSINGEKQVKKCLLVK